MHPPYRYKKSKVGLKQVWAVNVEVGERKILGRL